MQVNLQTICTIFCGMLTTYLFVDKKPFFHKTFFKWQIMSHIRYVIYCNYIIYYKKPYLNN